MKRIKSKRGSELLGQILLWVLLIGALLVFSVPFFFMISNSFEEFSYVLPYPPKLLPTRLDFSAYKHILELEIFPTAVWNSVVNTSAPLIISEQNRTRMRKTQRAAERIPSISSLPLFNNQRFQNAAIHMEIAQHANYPFARQTTKGLIQSTDKFAHSKNAGCLSQSRHKLQ